MKTKVNCFPDELKLKVVLEYLSTDVSQQELKTKYSIKDKTVIAHHPDGVEFQ